MADQALSGLSSTFVGWSGNMVEVLDVADTTSMSSASGANKKSTIIGLIANGSGAITTVSGATGAQSCNVAVSNWYLLQLSGNATVSVSGPTVGQQFSIIVQQAASGGPYNVTTWLSGSTVSWIGSPYSAPTVPTTASAYLIATFKCIGASTYLAWWLGNSAA